MLKFLLPYSKRFRFNKISVGVLRPYLEKSLVYLLFKFSKISPKLGMISGKYTLQVFFQNSIQSIHKIYTGKEDT